VFDVSIGSIVTHFVLFAVKLVASWDKMGFRLGVFTSQLIDDIA
jgi:hypothetical protein